MRICLIGVLLAASAAAYAQPPQCKEGAKLTRKLERLLERRDEDDPRVLRVATEIKDLQRQLLDVNPGKTIEEVCNVEETANADPDEQVVCRREQVLGTHQRVRICATRAERARARRESQETARAMRGE
jgi:hypothetical protein